MADGNKLKKYERGSKFQQRFNERYKERVLDKLPKRAFFQFLEILITKFGRLCLTNLLYLIFFAPFVYVIFQMLLTQDINRKLLYLPIYLLLALLYGPATAGLTYIQRKTIAGEAVFTVTDFFDQFRKNFKQGIIMGLLDGIFIFGAMIYASNFIDILLAVIYVEGTVTLQSAVMWGGVFLVTLIYFTMRYYIYMMMVTVELKMRQLIRNALAFVVLGAPTNILTFFICIALIIVYFALIPYTYFVVAVFGVSLIGLIINFNAYSKVKTHLIDPVTKPEQEQGDEEKIFSDQPVEESRQKNDETSDQN